MRRLVCPGKTGQGGNTGIYKTTDGGVTWTNMTGAAMLPTGTFCDQSWQVELAAYYDARVREIKGKAYLLADTSHAPLKVTRQRGQVFVALPADPPFEGALSDRINPQFAKEAARTHLHCVVVLETQSN